MAIRHMSYLDLSSEERAEGAKKARERLQTLQRNPFMTPEQQAQVTKMLEDIGKWERGGLGNR